MRTKPVTAGLAGAFLAVAFLAVILIASALPARPVRADDSQFYHGIRSTLNRCAPRYFEMGGEKDPNVLRVADRLAAYYGVKRDAVMADLRATAAEDEAYMASNTSVPRSRLVDEYTRICATELGIPAPGDTSPDFYEPRLDPMIRSADADQYCAWAWLHIGGSEDGTFADLVRKAATAQELSEDQVRTYARQRVDFLNEMINSGEAKLDDVKIRLRQCEAGGVVTGAEALIADRELTDKALADARSQITDAPGGSSGGALDNIPSGGYVSNNPDSGLDCGSARAAMDERMHEDVQRYRDGPQPAFLDCQQGGFDDSCYYRTSDQGIANVQAVCRDTREEMRRPEARRCSEIQSYLDEEYSGMQCDKWAPQS